MTHPSIWIVTEGMAGTENQCLGVAEALNLPYKLHKIKLNQPWKTFSPWLGWEQSATFSPRLTPAKDGTWPDILLTSGRKSIATARYIKKKSGGKTFTVQIQDPRISPDEFDLVALPEHDPTRGENVVVTNATPNRITPSYLKQAKEDFSFMFEKFPAPRLAVSIGGSTKSCTVTAKDLDKIVNMVLPLAKSYSLMITVSRRTGAEHIERLKKKLDIPHVFFWGGDGPNPYMGMLAWADAILVTNDSTAMISDAATTGKPTYVLPLVTPSRRQQILIDNLEQSGKIRPFNGKIEDYTYEPLNDAALIAAKIRERSGLFEK